MNVKKVEESTDLSREAANRLVKRFCEEGILVQKDRNVKYGRLFVYKDYLALFEQTPSYRGCCPFKYEYQRG